ncbi:MAG: hypothetical protein WCI72_06545 [archaeon]
MKIILPKELTLSGTDNNGKRHRYSIDKNSNLKGGLKKLLISLEFEEKKVEEVIKGIFFKETQEDEERGIIPRALEEIIDIVRFLKNDKYEVDMFFGKEKVILLIRITEKREKLVDAIEKNADWISEEEKEKRLKQNKGKARKIVESN